MYQNYGFCKGCGRQILFTRMRSGKLMPCDPEGVMFSPDPLSADVYITPEGFTVKGHPDKLGILGYTSHFATCPAADTFRRKK